MFRVPALNLCCHIDTKNWFWLVSTQRPASKGVPGKSIIGPCAIALRSSQHLFCFLCLVQVTRASPQARIHLDGFSLCSNSILLEVLKVPSGFRGHDRWTACFTEKWPSPSIGCVFYGEMAGSCSVPCLKPWWPTTVRAVCVFSDLTLSK